MKKLTKITLAGGLGAALLTGGAGSLAFWSDDAAGDSGVIQAGTLDLGTVTDGAWKISHVGDGTGTATTPVAFDPAVHTIVPGDVLTFTESVPVTLDGENLAAVFDGTIDITPTGPADAEDDALAAALGGDPDLAFTTMTGATGDLALGVDGALTGEGTGSVLVTTTVSFPWGTAGQYNAAKLGSLDFAVDYTLTQVAGN